jgi:hypothetical protein
VILSSANICATEPQIKKLNPHCFFKLLKLKKRKCTQIFLLRPTDGNIAMFSISWEAPGFAVSGEFTKCQYMCKSASNQKTKATLFSQTFKVKEKKVYSDFHLVTFSPTYWHIEFSRTWPKMRKNAYFKMQTPVAR